MGGDKKFDSDEAVPVAQEFIELIKPFVMETPKDFPWPFSHLITIAGSLRRCKQRVGDIEILLVPRHDERQIDFFTTKPIDLADEALNKCLVAGSLTKRLNVNGNPSAWGTKNKHAVATLSMIPIDFFSTCLENWFTSLVIRTGSKETILKLTTGAQRLGRTLHAYGDGVSEKWPDGRVQHFSARSEEDVFKLCGVPFVEVNQR